MVHLVGVDPVVGPGSMGLDILFDESHIVKGKCQFRLDCTKYFDIFRLLVKSIDFRKHLTNFKLTNYFI